MHAIRLILALTPITAALALAACAPAEGVCNGDFAITVGTGTNPTFTWDGDAAGLAVTEFPATATRLWVLGQIATPFPSPVTYGTVPSLAIESDGAAKPLVAGTEYAITITAGDGATASCQTFTP